MQPAPLRPARWRDERPRTRAAAGAILVLAGLLIVWNLGRSGEFVYYGAAVRSMSVSWRALAFGALDPEGTLTLDKLAGFLVPQALAVRLVGGSASALAVPQVAEGLVTIWCCGTIALRQAGARAGLVALGAAAATPVLVSVSGRPMEDGMLTAALAGALLQWQRAVLTGATWPLAVSGALVGVGFQAKMLQAWLVLPALVLGLVAAGGPRRRLAARIGLLGGVALVASTAWITAMQLVPASDRPVVDGTTDDDVFTMVFDYNGLDRLLPPAPGRLAPLLLHGAVAVQSSPVKLLLPYYLTQIGWLYPAALAGLVLGLLRWWPRAGSRTRARFATVVAVGAWLAVAVAVLSVARLPHTAYVAAAAVQLDVLAGIGFALAVRLRAAARPAVRFVLPALVVAQGAWGLGLAAASGLPDVLLAVLALLTAAGVLAALPLAALPLAALRHAIRTPALPRLGLALAGVALVAGSATWSLQSLDPDRAGTGVDAYVGVKARPGPAVATAAWRPRPPDLWEDAPRLTGALGRIVSIARRTPPRSGGILFATDSVAVSAPVIAATGREVLTDGGLSGRVAVVGEERLRRLVDEGRLVWAVTELRPARRGGLDRLVRSCRRTGAWAPRRADPVASRGLVLWRCGR